MDGKIDDQEVILSTCGVTKHFGNVHAVQNVDIEVMKGEVLSIVGANGAGKTTLLKLISGGHTLDSGRIIFMDVDVSGASLIHRARSGIVYSFQIPALFDNLSTLDNVTMALFSRKKKMFAFFTKLDSYTEMRAAACQILEMFNVPKNEHASQLPHGQRKLLDAAIAFAYNPQLLLLDEPTSGVSTDEKRQVMDTIIPNIEKRNITTIIVEHDMEIVVRYSGRVIVLDQGQIFAHGSPEEVMQNPRVREVLLGQKPA